MTDTAPPVPAPARLRAIALDLRRLTYCFRNPEPFYELRHELVVRLERLARDLETPPAPPPARRKPLKTPILTGTIAKNGRLISVMKRARRALQAGSDNRPSRK